MDGSKFDNLARALGQGTSRRAMLRGLAGGVAGILAGGALTHQSAGAAGRDLVICHATGDSSAPYQTMTIPQTEMNQHARHGDFVRVECCTDSDCPDQSGECGQGSCQSGYCIQQPLAAGTTCGGGQSCLTSGVCDGAFTCSGAGAPIVCAETENPCTTAICSEASGCQEVPADDASICTTSTGDDGTCSGGTCVAICPAGATCLFSNFGFPNAQGICADGECICKPPGGACNCNDITTFAGCCSGGCLCTPGTCL